MVKKSRPKTKTAANSSVTAETSDVDQTVHNLETGEHVNFNLNNSKGDCISTDKYGYQLLRKSYFTLPILMDRVENNGVFEITRSSIPH